MIISPKFACRIVHLDVDAGAFEEFYLSRLGGAMASAGTDA